MPPVIFNVRLFLDRRYMGNVIWTKWNIWYENKENCFPLKKALVYQTIRCFLDYTANLKIHTGLSLF